MRPGYQEQILYILNKHHSIVTVELGDAVTDDILQLIDSAKREAVLTELKWAKGASVWNIESRIAQLEQSKESK